MAPTTKLPELRVLHLDDDPFERDRVKGALAKHGLVCRFHLVSVADEEAYHAALMAQPPPDVVILDIHLGNTADGARSALGVQLAAQTRAQIPEAVILMCSTADDVHTIISCLHAGADDFISKQSDDGELSLRVYNAHRIGSLKHGPFAPALPRSTAGTAQLQPVGATMERVARRVPMIIGSAISAVFIRGESGTGKEVVADLFGDALPKDTPFIKVNCGAITPSLLESELFGHVKGAFTGAAADKRGLFEAASGGWIFLDEIATLSPQAQVALLRVLENQEVLRVGSTKPVKISARVLSATNEAMDKLVEGGKFRADLWQRLQEADILLPPLRERDQEIPALVQHFCRTMPGGPYTVSGPVLEVLRNVSWRAGNIRELRNCLRAMTEMHVDKLLTPLAIPERIWDELGGGADAASGLLPPAAAAASSSSIASSEAAALPSPNSQTLMLAWERDKGDEPATYDYMADVLLLAMTRQLARDKGKLSLRGLAQTIGMSRSTLSGRLKSLVQKNIIELGEITRLVGISDK